MYYIRVILKRDLKSVFTPKGNRSLKQWLGLIAGCALWLGMAVGLGYGAFRLFHYLSTALEVIPDLRRAVEINVLNGSAIFVLSLVFLVGIQTAYRTMYESDDVAFLMSQPIPLWSVFGAKFAVAFATLLLLTASYGLPVWFAFGYVRGLGASFYLLTTLGFIVLMLAFHSVVTLVLLAAMRYLPGRKLKQLFVALSAIFGIGVVLVTQVLSSRFARLDDTVAIIHELGKGQLSRTWYLPTTWMTNAILRSIPEFGIEQGSGWAALIVTALGGAYLATAMSTRWYLHGWSGRSDELHTGKQRKAKSGARAGAVPSNRLQGAYWSVLRKDLKCLWRDPVVWYTLVVGFIGLGFFAYNMSSHTAAGPATGDMVPPGLFIAMPAFMGAVAAAQTGGVSVSREGKSFWIVRSAPAGSRPVLLAKFTYAVLPQTLFLTTFAVFLEFTKLPHLPLWLGLGLGMLMAVAVASFQILLDVYFPDFTLKVEMGSSTAGKGTAKLLITLFTSMGLVVVLGLVLFLPEILEPRLSPGAGAAASYWSYACLAVIAAGFIAALLGPGTRRFQRLLSDM